MKKGFTLVELLVAISIIAILSTIGLVIFSGIQSKARDAIRKNDLNQLATALEVYYQKNNKYIEGVGTCEDTAIFYNPQTGIAPYLSGNVVPKDPKTADNYCYVSVNNGVSFRLFARLENCQDPQVINPQTCQTIKYNYSKVSDDLTVRPAPVGGVVSSSLPPPCDGYGDVNMDGVVTNTDGQEALRISNKYPTLSDGTTAITLEHKRRADVDGDGDVSLTDASKISRYAAGADITFPVCL